MKIELEKEIINKSINSFYFQVDHLVKIFTSKGDKILDPFSGAGTIPFEAALNGRRSYGLDIGLLATSVSNAKLMVPSRNKVKLLIGRLDKYIESKDPSSKTQKDSVEVKFNKTIKEYFHEATLREVLLARDFFRKNQRPGNPEWALLLSCMLHILHGNRPYALSRRSHPLTPYAPTGEYIYKNLIHLFLNYLSQSRVRYSP